MSVKFPKALYFEPFPFLSLLILFWESSIYRNLHPSSEQESDNYCHSSDDTICRSAVGNYPEWTDSNPCYHVAAEFWMCRVDLEYLESYFWILCEHTLAMLLVHSYCCDHTTIRCTKSLHHSGTTTAYPCQTDDFQIGHHPALSTPYHQRTEICLRQSFC